MEAYEQMMKKNRLIYGLYVGFFAGLIWGTIKILAYYLGFTKVIPAFIADAFFKHDALEGWVGHIAYGLISFIIFSMIVSFLYALLFHKVNGYWLGLAYGVIWWVLIYIAVGPYIGMVPKILDIDWNSRLTDFCIFLMWGIFIGYTIAYEYTEERTREPFTNFDQPKSEP